MSLADRFEAFFAAANDGAGPYPWQIALMQRVADMGTWPAAITAPTGSGKSSVVDIHVFLVAERQRQRLRQTVDPTIARPPRRLVLVAPRRVLVDDQHGRATRLAELLRCAEGPGALAEVREALESLVTTEELRDEGPRATPLGVARLRGGVRLDLTWRLDPARCQIICATPQMWGSRLLLRGFRSSRRARNLESGLLAHDVTVVIDEAHLHKRLVETARRVSDMGRGKDSLQIVAMSATHAAPGGHALTSADLLHDELARRVRAPKTVEVDVVDDWARERSPRIVAATRRLREADPEIGTVGVFVNTVAIALDVADRLKSDKSATVCVVCGRMRPADLQRLRSEFPGLLDARGNAKVTFLVTTQSLEVGVDLDLRAMVSELAPASALAQRAGRLNRSGTRAQTTLVVVVPRELADGGDPAEVATSFLPYQAVELHDGLRWLEELDGNISPERIGETQLPPVPALAVPAITAVELETLAMTSIELAADPDPDFYIEQPIDSVTKTVFVAARDHVRGMSEPVVRQMLEAAPPRAHELAPVTNAKTLERVLKECAPTWTLRTENGTLGVLRTDPDPKNLRDGDVVVIPSGSRVSVERVLDAKGRDPIDDVIARRVDDVEPDAILPLDGHLAERVGEFLEADAILGTRAMRRELAEIVKAAGAGPLATRLKSHPRLSDLTVTWCADQENPKATCLLVVVASEREGSLNDQIATTSVVTLDDHCAEVAARMSTIVDKLDGLVDAEAEDLVSAARLHDGGKLHPAFQARMGRKPEDPALAKPRPQHRPDRGDGWRHEQLSAAMAHDELRRRLATTLVGAHHGAGLPAFNRDHTAARAGWIDCPQSVVDALAELFGPHGRYEADRAALQREHGIHRLAFLEALVRCADIQVSREVHD